MHQLNLLRYFTKLRGLDKKSYRYVEKATITIRLLINTTALYSYWNSPLIVFFFSNVTFASEHRYTEIRYYHPLTNALNNRRKNIPSHSLFISFTIKIIKQIENRKRTIDASFN